MRGSFRFAKTKAIVLKAVTSVKQPQSLVAVGSSHIGILVVHLWLTNYYGIVYVKYKVDDEVTKYAWLADVLDDQLTELEDGGIGTHGIMYTAQNSVQDEKVDDLIKL